MKHVVKILKRISMLSAALAIAFCTCGTASAAEIPALSDPDWTRLQRIAGACCYTRASCCLRPQHPFSPSKHIPRGTVLKNKPDRIKDYNTQHHRCCGEQDVFCLYSRHPASA